MRINPARVIIFCIYPSSSTFSWERSRERGSAGRFLASGESSGHEPSTDGLPMSLQIQRGRGWRLSRQLGATADGGDAARGDNGRRRAHELRGGKAKAWRGGSGVAGGVARHGDDAGAPLRRKDPSRYCARARENGGEVRRRQWGGHAA